ncbi:DUF6157 family protein [Sphingobacterium sp. LRF_L2]|uniref:DUF6157 family protein n=1 Tax=Sphingobacterium sp. LRF_L2 TaxID=3369421 RepID=UPI003F6447DA
MKTHSTNYFNTLITVAEDTKAVTGICPVEKGENKTIANYQYALLMSHPYCFTSDGLIFSIHAQRKELLEKELEQARMLFFSKGQPCLRTSPLTKQYGWGIHANSEGKVKLVNSSSSEYLQLLEDPEVTKVAAMKSKR